MRKPETTGEWVQMGAYAATFVASALLLTRAFDRTIDVPMEYIPITGYDANNNPRYWDANNLTQEIAHNLHGWNLFTYPEIVGKIHGLNNAQVALLWNTYNQRFAEIPFGPWTLTRLIEGEWTDWGQDYEMAIERFKRLGLY